jgi:fluoride exporter
VTTPTRRSDPVGHPPAGVLVAVALGGAIGAPLRYGLSQLVPNNADEFPWATFVTNVSGSFVLGVVLIVLVRRFPTSRYARPFLAVGVLGAYTTFSTFAVETDRLVGGGHAGTALAYVGLSLVAGLAGSWLGIGAGHGLTRRMIGSR